MILRKYLRKLKDKKINYLILGCTHYPFLLNEIKKIIGKRTKIINTPEVVAQKLEEYLKKHQEIEQDLIKDQKRIFYTTDEPGRFKVFSNKFLPDLKIDKIEKVDISK